MKSYSLKDSQGATLILGLIMLLLATIVGLSGARTAHIEEKISGSIRDRQVAFQAAEAALRLGQEYVENSANLNVGDAGIIAASEAVGTASAWREFDWQQKGVQPSPENEIAGVSVQPYFVIEVLDSGVNNSEIAGKQLEFGSVKPKMAYRITARGTGVTTDAEVFLQALLEKL